MQLDFDATGDGEPLILLHGLFASKRNIRALALHLSSYYRVYTLTARNHRHSVHSERFDYHLMAEDVLAFMQQQRIERPYLVGHSMGGKTCMVASHLFGSRIQAVCVLDIATSGPRHDYTPLLQAMHQGSQMGFFRRTPMLDWMQHQVGDRALAQFLLLNYDFNHGRWLINLPSLAANHEQITQFPQLSSDQPSPVPLLMLKAEHSDYLDSSSLPHAQTLFQHVQLVEFAQTSHWLHTEKPTQIGDRIRRFLLSPEVKKRR